MKANLEYSAYSSNLEKAIIPMTAETHDLQLSSLANSLPDGVSGTTYTLRDFSTMVITEL